MLRGIIGAIAIFGRLRQLDDSLVPAGGDDNEATLLGLAVGGLNVMVLSLALVPEPFNAPVALLLSLPLAAPYVNVWINRWFGE